MRNRILSILLIFLATVPSSGCWDYEDINKRSIALSIGVDKKDGEVILNGEIAQLVASPGKESNTATISDVYHFTSTGKNFEEARYDFDHKIPNLDFSGAIISIAFSEEYAKEKGIESYINRFSFISGFRQSALGVVSQQHTDELFKEKVINDISTGHSIRDTIRYLVKDGASIYTTVQDIRHNISFKEIGFLLPYVKKNNDTLEYLGLAVIKDSKFVGSIKTNDSRGAIYLLNSKASFNESIPNPVNKNNLFAIKTKLKKRKISTSFNNGEINIDIRLDLKVELLYEYITESTSHETIRELEDTISKLVKDQINSVLERSQKEFNCDFIGFGRYFKADNPLVFKKINWVEEYPNARFNIEVSSKITSYNLLNIK